jgi:hypothetical protein
MGSGTEAMTITLAIPLFIFAAVCSHGLAFALGLLVGTFVATK